MNDLHRCIICGKDQKNNFTVCIACQRKYPPNFIYEQSFVHGGKWNEKGVDLLSTRNSRTVTPSFIRYVERKIHGNGETLEIGCGRGYLSCLFQSMGKSVISIDFSKVSVHYCRSLRLSCVRSDAQNLPFKNNAFTLVYSNELFEHLFCPDLHLREVYRVLKNRGHYIIKTPNKLLDDIYCRLIERKKDFRFWHPSTLYSFQIRRKMLKAGFDVTVTKPDQLPPSQIQKLPHKLFRKLATRYHKFLPTILQPSFIIDCVKTDKPFGERALRP